MTAATHVRSVPASPAPASERPRGVRADSSGRYDVLDAVRGLAVLAMIAVHLIGAEGGVSAFGRGLTYFLARIEPTTGAMFCVVAGISWAIQAERSGVTPAFRRYLGVRALALGVFGVVFHALLWRTEILIAFAMMMALSLVVLGRGPRATLVMLVLFIAVTPLVTHLVGNYARTDWMMDGSHLADSAFGWVTVRSLFFDGNYPLVSWMAFPLMGILFWQTARSRDALRRWCVGAIAVALVAQAIAILGAPRLDALEYTQRYVEMGWTPTSAMFLLTAGISSLAIIAALLWSHGTASMSRPLQPIVLFGRASLTHYVLHIAVAYSALRLMYPDEDWPLRVGALAMVIYLAIGVPLTMVWFRRHTHGPFEAAWARASRRPPARQG